VDLRKKVLSDLLEFVHKLQRDGHDLVVGIDANEKSDVGTGLARFLLDSNLVDAHNPDGDIADIPKTYQRSKEKIDFVLISPRLREAVVSASILPICDGYLSDHRALVVDFDPFIVFGSDTSDLVPPRERRIVSTNPRTVSPYIEAIRQQFAYHKIVKRVAALMNQSNDQKWTDLSVDEWERIDSLLLESKVMAEGRCPAKPSGQYPWSPDLKRAGKNFLYWKLRRTSFYAVEENAAALLELADLGDVPEDLRGWLSSKDVHANKRRAKSELTKMQKISAKLRKEFLDEVASFSAALKRTDAEKAAKEIAILESMKQRYRTLGRVFHSSGGSMGLDRIDVPNLQAVRQEGEEIPRIPLVVREDIEEVLVPHTKKRFQQHQETPFGQGERQRRLGTDCTSEDAQKILDGMYDYELDDLSEEVKDWLLFLRKKDHVREGGTISTDMTTEEWVLGWTKMRESTSSCPPDHFGHYKTAAKVYRLPENHPDSFKDLAEVYASMESLPLWNHYLRGMVLRRSGGNTVLMQYSKRYQDNQSLKSCG